jgi:methylated-DNA-protein-cysteine methyltransferase related protein
MRHGRRTLAALLRPLSTEKLRQSHASEADDALSAIWHVVCAIPRGRVSTYGAVARAAALPGRARQVGYALRVAPRSLDLPWHRVMGAGGRIVFPKSSPQHLEQARRLRAEGVQVRGGRVPADVITNLEEL